MWPLFFSALTEALFLVGRRMKRRWRLELWQDIAAARGLHVVEKFGTWVGPPMLKAFAGPVEVRFEDAGLDGTRVVIVVLGPQGYSELMIRRELDRPSGPADIEVGDELFDSTFYVLGPIRIVRALLDAETRRLLVRVNAECPLEITDGELRAEMPETHLPSLLPLLLDLGRRFAQHLDLPRRFAENARQDPEHGVRLRNLRLLARELPGAADTVEALRTACSDPSPEIRLQAAQALGAEGCDVLLELAQSESDDTWTAQAVSILDGGLPLDRATTILTAALRRRRILTARACLEILGRSGDVTAIPILAKVLAREQGELAAAAALALGTTGGTAAQAHLIQALQAESTDVLVAAANALGQVGTAEAVVPLKEAAERSPKIGRAARQAIAAIQSRLPGATPGQLSLAAAEAGQLSLVPAEAGQLSLATDPAGQLSLPRQEAGQLSLTDPGKGF
jgi:HEAT repeat protein